ncbi:leucine-rich_repeat domain-containing protein [Hexamita inflata]|uniref:Leucine-rich_repeat domain-containing protein n=1 Tax=Hexamita inflata TaxID=28002 RepID=A0ABP1L2K9_9EUKA
MKQINNQMKNICMVSDKTKFTDQNVIQATIFEANQQIIKQVDKIPIQTTSLVIVDSYLCSTQGIYLHVNIKHLDLRSNCLQTVDLRYLVNLEYVDLSFNYIQNMDSISGNTNIQTLNLAQNKIYQVDFIATLPKLKMFNIEGNLVQNLEPLQKHSNFSKSWVFVQKQQINLYKTIKYNDAIRITNDQKLIFLNFQNITQIFIAACHNVTFIDVPILIKQLVICNSDIKSLSGLDKMLLLETLTLRQCSLSRIQNQLEIIKTLPNLRYLDIAQNDLDNTKYICNEKLISLNMSHNNLKSLDGLKSMDKLISLDVSDNKLDSVSELSDLVDLMELNISFNTIHSILCLQRLKKLIYFNLTCNKIINIEICTQMKNLIDLRTFKNQIQNQYVLLEHLNFVEVWLSEQLIPDNSNEEVKQLNEQGKNYNMIQKYKKQVQNNSLEINNDQYVKSLKFSDIIGVTKELFISKCRNVSFEVVPAIVQSLKVNSSNLKNIFGLEQLTQITYLELNNNLLEDVIEIQELTKLIKLVLSNNKIGSNSSINQSTLTYRTTNLFLQNAQQNPRALLNYIFRIT